MFSKECDINELARNLLSSFNYCQIFRHANKKTNNDKNLWSKFKLRAFGRYAQKLRNCETAKLRNWTCIIPEPDSLEIPRCNRTLIFPKTLKKFNSFGRDRWRHFLRYYNVYLVFGITSDQSIINILTKESSYCRYFVANQTILNALKHVI